MATAFGAGRSGDLRNILHRSMLTATLIYVVFALPLLLNAEYLLVWVAPSARVSALAGRYLTILIPGGFFRVQYQVLSKLLESQNLALPGLVTNIVMSVVVFVLNVFVRSTQL